MSNVTTDPIADMLTRIRNAVSVRKQTVNVPYSAIKHTIARLLKESGFIYKYTVDETDSVKKNLVIELRGEDDSFAITSLKKLSTPGRRIYSSADKIPTIKRGRGIVIISTSQGLMTGGEARKRKLGGELICEVY